MDGKLQVIAGILALFFLGVAIAKSLIQRARKREEAARRIAASKESQEVSLHNPFAAGEEPATPQEDGGEEEVGGDIRAPRSDEAGGDLHASGGEAPAESIYMWE